MSTNRPRRLTASVAFGVVLALAPLPFTGTVTEAEAPSVVVTGLARGARGEAVRAVQDALMAQGVDVPGGVDGIFGAATEQAVRAFQELNGIRASGEVDLATAIALGLERSPLLGLTQGNQGDLVRTLQDTLAAAGHAPRGGTDGVFGPATTTAVSDFQRARGLSPSGSIDVSTAAELSSVAVGGTGPNASASSDAEPAAVSGSNATLVGLAIGSTGPQVERVQRILIGAGFTVVGGADGVYGALTANAVRSFQNANGLPLSGSVDATTADTLALVEARQGGADSPDVDASPSGGTPTDDPAPGDDLVREDGHDPVVASPFAGLQYGSLGADVAALQQALIDAGIAVRGGADGAYGPATRDAVRSFQRANDLEQTGRIDAATADALASRRGGAANSELVGLKAGSLGNTVAQLQQALIDAGVRLRGGADGIFGPATASAVRTFQTAQGLEATGVVDAATAAALAAPTPMADPQPDTDGDEVGFAVYGERGDRVRALQQALVDAGITVRGGVDGDFGGATAAAVMEFQRQRGLTVTGKVDAATGAALGLAPTAPPSAPAATGVTLSVFPVQGPCHFGDSYGYPRSGGRVHLGVDVIAPEGNLLYAVADGTISKLYRDYPGSLAGNGVRLQLADGTYFFYAHMSGLADGVGLGTKVVAGQIIGYVGNTGNSGTPHLHFEIHPQGGAAINPYPLVKAIDGCSRTEPLPQP